MFSFIVKQVDDFVIASYYQLKQISEALVDSQKTTCPENTT